MSAVRLLISATSDKLDLEKKQYVTLRQQMTEEETAFQSEKNEFDIYVRQRGLADSIRRFQQQLNKTISDIQEDEQNIKEIGRELRKLPNKKEVEEKYIAIMAISELLKKQETSITKRSPAPRRLT